MSSPSPRSAAFPRSSHKLAVGEEGGQLLGAVIEAGPVDAAELVRLPADEILEAQLV